MSVDFSRKDIDDIGRRNNRKDSYKNRYFAGRRTAQDEYTGKRLYYAQSGKVSSASGRHFTTQTTANIDHIKPIDQILDQYGTSVSKEDLKDIANSDYNLAATSEALNKSKQGQSNHEYLLKQLKNKTPENACTTYNMLKSEIQAEMSIAAHVATKKTIRLIGKKLAVSKTRIYKAARVAGATAGRTVGAGTSAALVSLTVSGINNIALAASGNKDIKQAAADVAKDVGGSFATGAGLELFQSAVIDIAKNANSPEILKLMKNGIPIAEISTIIMVGNSIVRFINDDITMEECATELLMNGAGMVAHMLGMGLGGPAGAIVASLVMAQISNSVLEYRAIAQMSAQKLLKANYLVAKALVEMEYQRRSLKELITKEYSKWDASFDAGFEKIITAALSNDTNGISHGLNEILSVFGETVKFKSTEEFDQFFMDESNVFSF